MTEANDVVLARIDQRLIVVEREVRDIKAEQQHRRPQWPVVMSSLAALGALLITIIKVV